MTWGNDMRTNVLTNSKVRSNLLAGALRDGATMVAIRELDCGSIAKFLLLAPKVTVKVIALLTLSLSTWIMETSEKEEIIIIIMALYL